MKRVLSFASIICVLCFAVLAASAQKDLSVGSPATENFNSMIQVNVNLFDNVTIPGVYAYRTIGNAIPNTLDANNGDFTSAGLFNMGSTGSAETGFAETLTFEYQTGATVTSLIAGTWTSVAALNYTNPNNPGGQGTLDGNAAENRTTLSATFAVTILPGTEIMLRWTDIENGGQLDGLAIDDVTVTAIAPSAADARISGRVTDSFGRSISYAAITVQDFSGTSKVVFTNTFGYYRIEGLEAGETYVLTVSSRRYTFTNASMVINLGDNFDGANFVARR